MAQNSVPPHVDPQELAAYQSMWRNFTVFTKWGIIGVCSLLILMALFIL